MTWGKFILNHVDCYARPQQNGVTKQPQARGAQNDKQGK
jgi:hypothetical protein